jgi:hypothetical protein
VPIQKQREGTNEFPIQKWMIFCNAKEIKGLRGDVLQYIAQVIPPIDAGIAKKSRFWMETS